MTDKELQDLISLKKYEQPQEGYFDDFLVEFQQRQRSEMLKTSARGLLLERAKAWFSEFGAMRWVIGAGVAYASIALVLNLSMSNESPKPAMVTDMIMQKESIVPTQVLTDENATGAASVSMVFIEPVDFSSPAPVFATEEKIF